MNFTIYTQGILTDDVVLSFSHETHDKYLRRKSQLLENYKAIINNI